LENWDEIRTAYQVARAGTVSGAAEVLGVHHATVIRHIDSLEGQLGVKLFQRHARGYTPTEAGVDLFNVAETTDDQFGQLENRIKGLGQGVSGDLVVTSLDNLAGLLAPVLVEYQAQNPNLRIRYLTGDRLFRLEYGEAHVALRAGTMPEDPDNVVQPFATMGVSLVMSQRYKDRKGMPESESDFPQHDFVGYDNEESRAPYNKWLRQVVPSENVVFLATNGRIMLEAILAGAGIGFVSAHELNAYPELIEVIPPKKEWTAPLWLVTHVDLHRTVKVRSFLDFLKVQASDWIK
jgi:DNA-binding transcriptional LysR family regulator